MLGRNGNIRALAFATLLSATSVAAATDTQQTNAGLHVPSPDWRDQIVYFLMIDRFADGESRNNDQGVGEFDPCCNAKYSGGDLKGIAERLDYIQGLGATAVWITPPVAHQWWDPQVNYGGYHGYWGEHFMQVDRHFGALADYQALSAALHQRGMYLIQDIVVNHVGNYFGYPQGWDSNDPGRNFRRFTDAQGRNAPTQSPFDQNNALDPRQRAAQIYHWTPRTVEFESHQQLLNHQLADLDDLNTENPRVRETLRDSYSYWIKTVGVDAYRVDTVFHVPPAFFADFLYSADAVSPGVLHVAERSGRQRFHVFGEGFGIDRAFENTQAKRIDRYLRDAAGKPLLPGMLNFPLYGSTNAVFAEGHPTAELGYRIRSMMQIHAAPQLMPTFVDNHDVQRFLAGGSVAGLKQALLLIMTLPGIPTLYYGTEQGFVAQRGAMFGAGFASGGNDHFDPDAPLYRFIQRATQLRRSNPLFSRGTPTVLRDNAAGPGVLAYRMDADDQVALVAFNSADRKHLLDGVQTGLPPGTQLEGIFGNEKTPPNLVVEHDGRVTVALPPREGWVWRKSGQRPTPPKSTAAIDMLLEGPRPRNGRLKVSGRAHGVERLQLLVDGDLTTEHRVTPDGRGRWSASIDTASMIDPGIEHRLRAWSESAGVLSDTLTFKVKPQWRLLAEVDDAAGDDSGPSGHRYDYPNDPSWGANRQLDLRGARLFAAGSALKLELRMHRFTADWNPPNGFDHVIFTVFIELPQRHGGSTVMPLQNANLPDGGLWHYRLRVGGWSNALFTADGAAPNREGTPVASAAQIELNRKTNTLSLVFPASSLARPTSFSGARVYVNTWDYDGGYRTLATAPDARDFRGGDGQVDPLLMDELLLEVP